MNDTNDMLIPAREDLQTGDWPERGRAAALLSLMGGDKDLPHLTDALQDEVWAVRALAARGVGYLGDSKSIPSLLQALDDPDWPVRVDAARALARIGDSLAVPRLIEALESDDAEIVRATAAIALGGIGDRAALPTLRKNTQSTQSQLRAAVLYALSLFKDRDSIPYFTACLTDPDWTIRLRAVVALGWLGSVDLNDEARSSIVQALLAYIEDKQWSIRSALALSMGHLGGSDSHKALLTLAKDSEWPVRQNAVFMLGRQAAMPQDSAVLIQALHDPIWSIRTIAALALAISPDKAALPSLTALQTAPEAWVRWAAARAIQAIRGEEIPSLTTYKADFDPTIVWSVIWGLALQDELTGSDILHFLKNPNPTIKHAAMAVLGIVGHTLMVNRQAP